MSAPKITMLAWSDDFRQCPGTTCLFSDGIEFWTGWYDGDCIYVKGPDGAARLSLGRVTHWAKLNNLLFALEPIR